MTRTALALTLLAVIVGTISCDRVTKHFAVAELSGTPRQSYLGDTVRLDYAENTGGFLSLGADWPPAVRMSVFTIGNGLMLFSAVVLGIRLRAPGAEAIGLALVCSGGISNLIDRLARGTVIDFLNVGLGPLRTGIFNVADMAVLAGVAVFLIAHGRRTRA
jgi:signal peptidase II